MNFFKKEKTLKWIIGTVGAFYFLFYIASVIFCFKFAFAKDDTLFMQVLIFLGIGSVVTALFEFPLRVVSEIIEKKDKRYYY